MRNTAPRRPLILLTAALVLAAFAVARTAQEVRLKGGVELVTVDLLAFGRDGRPVADLTGGDLSLRVNGRPREIRSFH